MQCELELESKVQDEKNSYGTLELVILVIIVTFILFMVLIYRRVIKRQMESEMSK
jgi:preprotein translocase subunit YajC